MGCHLDLGRPAAAGAAPGDMLRSAICAGPQRITWSGVPFIACRRVSLSATWTPIHKEASHHCVAFSFTVGPLRPVFSAGRRAQGEEELVRQVLDLKKQLHRLTLLDLRKTVFEFASENNIKNPFNKAKQLAGEGWMAGFRKRHPEIKLQKPESTTGYGPSVCNKHHQTARVLELSSSS